jgi:Putative transmembrane protein 170
MPRHEPPDGYQTPSFPSLYLHLLDETPTRQWTLYYVGDIWRFTLMWTLIIYAIFHLGAAAVAILMHWKTRAAWKFLWLVPVVFVIVAGVEALFAASLTGLMSVPPQPFC